MERENTKPETSKEIIGFKVAGMVGVALGIGLVIGNLKPRSKEDQLNVLGKKLELIEWLRQNVSKGLIKKQVKLEEALEKLLVNPKEELNIDDIMAVMKDEFISIDNNIRAYVDEAVDKRLMRKEFTETSRKQD